eukprot:Gb_19926 [translate_table: standard]
MMRFLLFLLALGICSRAAWADNGTCRAWLVQSIPTDMPELRRVPGVLSTGDVLQWLAGNSSSKLDIIAQYWQLVAQPDNPKSGDYGYTVADLESFGAPVGQAVFKSLENAADRNVSVRSPTWNVESCKELYSVRGSFEPYPQIDKWKFEALMCTIVLTQQGSILMLSLLQYTCRKGK